MSKRSSKSSRVSRATDLIDGMKKHFQNASEQLPFGGATYTVAQVIAALQGIVDLRSAVVAAQATAKAKVVAERGQLPPLVAVLGGLVAFLLTRFGSDAETLADFGLKPRKAPAPKTAEEKAVAAAKAKATREARGTKSAKAKKDIKGNISAELVVTAMTSEPAKTAPSNGAK